MTLHEVRLKIDIAKNEQEKRLVEKIGKMPHSSGMPMVEVVVVGRFPTTRNIDKVTAQGEPIDGVHSKIEGQKILHGMHVLIIEIRTSCITVIMIIHGAGTPRAIDHVYARICTH